MIATRYIAIGAILALFLIAPVLADDSATLIGANWQGIGNRINVKDADNPVQYLLYPYLPDWLISEDVGQYPDGAYWQPLHGLPAGVDTSVAIGNGTTPLALIAGRVFDMEGAGTWELEFRMLNGESHTFTIYKSDATLFGIGASHLNLTDGSRWFNTTFTQPRLIGISGDAFYFSVAYNLNTTETAMLVYDRSSNRYMKLFSMIPVTQNYPDYVMFTGSSGAGHVVGSVYGLEYTLLITTAEKMQESGADLFEEILTIIGVLYDIVMTVYALFDWLVLKLGLVLVILLVEMGMLAYYSTTSKNVFQFYQRMIRANRALFEFLIGFAGTIIQLLKNVKDMIPIIRYL